MNKWNMLINSHCFLINPQRNQSIQGYYFNYYYWGEGNFESQTFESKNVCFFVCKIVCNLNVLSASFDNIVLLL